MAARAFVQRAMLLVCGLLICDCAAVRYGDYKLGAWRLDRPSNAPVPGEKHPAVQSALADWNRLSEEERRKYPTPYHTYVDTPAPGSFEGEHVVALAFSGGGTRGTVFAAACVRALQELGPIVSEGSALIDLIAETDYVSGISTGAIPAAAFALNFGELCPAGLRFDQWPACFNRSGTARSLSNMAMRPDWLLQSGIIGMNNRAPITAALASLYFEGNRMRPRSGLTFAQLPSRPVLLIGSAIINDPAAPFVHTRLPYRFALEQPQDVPWSVGIQSFETFGTDPMSYSLAEACYNSLSFPAQMRSGLMRVHTDLAWIARETPASLRDTMAHARRQNGYDGIYELKDGGIADNRGTYLLARLLEEETLFPPSQKPLLISLDASILSLRAPAEGKGRRSGWMREFTASYLASWQTGQNAYQELVKKAYGDRFDLVSIRYTSWLPYIFPRENDPKAEEAAARLKSLCADYPLIQTPERLLEIAQDLGTTFSTLTTAQMEAVELAARFAVWHERDALLRWASARHNDAPARFSAGAL